MWVDLSQAVAPTPIPTLPSRAFSRSSDRKKNKSTLFFDKIKKEHLTFILNTL